MPGLRPGSTKSPGELASFRRAFGKMVGAPEEDSPAEKPPPVPVPTQQVVVNRFIIEPLPPNVQRAIARRKAVTASQRKEREMSETTEGRMTAHNWLAALAGVLATLGGLLWVVMDTPPRRAANESLWLQEGIEKQRTRQEEERTKQILATSGAGQGVASSSPSGGGSFIGGDAPVTHQAVTGRSFDVNGTRSDRPAMKALFPSVPKGITGAYMLTLQGNPGVAVWSPEWSASPSPDVNAFLRKYSVETPQWLEMYVRGPVKVNM